MDLDFRPKNGIQLSENLMKVISFNLESFSFPQFNLLPQQRITQQG
jgi:hypothetical protein